MMEAFVRSEPPVAQEWWTAPPNSLFEWLDTARPKNFIAVVRRDEDSRIAAEFRTLADQWEHETGVESFAYRKVTHPAFARILRMGRPVVPLALQRLDSHPTQWLVLLSALTDENPTEGATSMREAVESWRQWGRDHGLIG